jgi:prolyl oligopeptidase
MCANKLIGLGATLLAGAVAWPAAAAFQASGRSRPVLLRIDEEAGHGIGSTKAQTDALTADWIAFVLWQAGVPQWQPWGQ